MKVIIVSVALCLIAGVSGAQEQAPDTPQRAAVQAPATPAPAAKPAPDMPSRPAAQPPAVPEQAVPQAPDTQVQPAAPAKPETVAELKKLHMMAIVGLKKSQEDAVRKLKAAMKGRSVTDTRQAVAGQRAAGKTALKALQEEQKKELAEFLKKHPEKKSAPVPARK